MKAPHMTYKMASRAMTESSDNSQNETF